MATHRIASTPETVRWGVFDPGFPPLITINSGDTLVLECVSGGPEVMPPPEFRAENSRLPWPRSMPPTSRARPAT